jgi:SM-20-related protein
VESVISSKGEAAVERELEFLDAAVLESAPLHREPFDYVFAARAIRPENRESLLQDAPLVLSSGSIPVTQLSFGPAFQALIEDLESLVFRKIVERKFNLTLEDCLTTVSVRGRLRKSSDGYIHTDLADKVISVLLYLNDDWRHEGGALRVLRSRDIDDYALEIPPEFGNILIFRRSDRSWHGHLPYAGSRLSVQFNWVTSARRPRQYWRHKFNFLKALIPSRA